MVRKTKLHHSSNVEDLPAIESPLKGKGGLSLSNSPAQPAWHRWRNTLEHQPNKGSSRGLSPLSPDAGRAENPNENVPGFSLESGHSVDEPMTFSGYLSRELGWGKVRRHLVHNSVTSQRCNFEDISLAVFSLFVRVFISNLCRL